MKNLEAEKGLWEKELWTQNEVAAYFRVVPSTVKNWREQGFLSYFQPLGSSRVLYYSDEIRQFRDSNTINKKGGGAREAVRPTKEKPDISATRKEWRI